MRGWECQEELTYQKLGWYPQVQLQLLWLETTWTSKGLPRTPNPWLTNQDPITYCWDWPNHPVKSLAFRNQTVTNLWPFSQPGLGNFGEQNCSICTTCYWIWQVLVANNLNRFWSHSIRCAGLETQVEYWGSAVTLYLSPFSTSRQTWLFLEQWEPGAMGTWSTKGWVTTSNLCLLAASCSHKRWGSDSKESVEQTQRGTLAILECQAHSSAPRNFLPGHNAAFIPPPTSVLMDIFVYTQVEKRQDRSLSQTHLQNTRAGGMAEDS